MNPKRYRDLPSVNEVLAALPALSSDGVLSHEALVDAVRQELAEIRHRLRTNAAAGVPELAALAAAAAARLAAGSAPVLRRVINATGVVLHTNLGRAPMAEAAAAAACEAARGYLNLELDLRTGTRSSRQNAVRGWLCRLTGAESATAVNNNAAATVIVLRAVCRHKEVVVSRGQLIEIGGSFRIPEIMTVSGALLREVGTTNITRLADYERAIGPETGALLRVHPSNYRVRGFTKSVPLEELVALGRKHGLPVIDDVGSGALLDFGRFALEGEPLVKASVATGADLVLFSGDKLLGGPQAGLIVGGKKWIHRIERDPFMRTFRLDKMVLAALEATLRLYLNEEVALREVSVLRLLGTPLDELQRRAEALASQLRSLPGVESVRVQRDASAVGGGSLPDQTLPTWSIVIQPSHFSDAALAERLRTGTPAVVGRLHGGRLLLDLRTVFPQQDVDLAEAVRQALVNAPTAFAESDAQRVEGDIDPGALTDSPLG
jgi:L-seryl-tRNA(Ser) seleniumtransferase